VRTSNVTDPRREQRFVELYEQSRRRLLAYALRRTACAEDAADVVADTFAITWSHLDEVPEGETAVLWLYAVARGAVANLGRKGRRRSEVVGRLGAELKAASAGRATGAEPEDALVAARILGALNEDDRELLMLVTWEGLGPAELGCIFNCSPTAARIRLHRARVRLRTSLAQSGLSKGRVDTPACNEPKEVERHERNGPVAKSEIG
jgi:RNA polymerase sigma factor (sigma-70 family)